MSERKTLLVAFKLDEAAKETARAVLNGAADLVCLTELAPTERAAAIFSANALLAWNIKDFTAAELALLGNARLVQFMTAGVDFIPLSNLSANVPIASNGGAYAEPMAEHALAMAMAAAKRIVRAHGEVARGEFHQHRRNRMLAGGVCGVVGYGGIGVATARLMRAVGMKVHAVNRTPRIDDLLDWSGTQFQLDMMLAAADVLVIAVPLTKATQGLIGARELKLMKSDATLINLARGEIVDEAALYAHLQANPDFHACIDAWWVEPVRHGEFRMDHPFTDLSNVVASPHNSSSAGQSGDRALRRAVENCRRALLGERPLHLVRPEDRMQ